MVHGDPITNADGSKFDRGSTGHVYASFDCVDNLTEVRMPGNNLVGGIDNADERSSDFGVGITDRFEQGTMGGSFNAFFNRVAFHAKSSLKKNRYQRQVDNGFQV